MSELAKTILVADDDSASRELIAEVLRACGYMVVEVADGAEAVEILDRYRPDLVVVDIQMPKLSGFDIVKHLRGHIAALPLPVLAVTAHAMRGDRERALRAGFDDYLTKPVEAADLRQRVEELLRRV